MALRDGVTSGIQIGSSAASAAIPVLTTAATAAWAVPVVGAAAAAALIAWAAFKRRAAQKAQSSQIADEVEKHLQANLAAYMNGPRRRADRAAALAMFDDAWDFMASPRGCGSPDLGRAGKACISERERGGTAPWCPTGTGCDWFILYRDPIAQDITPDESNHAGPEAQADLQGLLVPAALILAAMVL